MPILGGCYRFVRRVVRNTRNSVLHQLRLRELRLRELLQGADRVCNLRTVRRRELDQLLAFDVALLLETDVTALRDENLAVRLTFDAHTQDLLGTAILGHVLARHVAAPASRPEEPERRSPPPDRSIAPRLGSGLESSLPVRSAKASLGT